MRHVRRVRWEFNARSGIRSIKARLHLGVFLGLPHLGASFSILGRRRRAVLSTPTLRIWWVGGAGGRNIALRRRLLARRLREFSRHTRYASQAPGRCAPVGSALRTDAVRRWAGPPHPTLVYRARFLIAFDLTSRPPLRGQWGDHRTWLRYQIFPSYAKAPGNLRFRAVSNYAATNV